MRRLRIAAWWLAPVVVIAWHYAGSGRQQLSADLARDQIRQANALEARGDTAESAETYRQAAATLSDVDKSAQQRLRLAAAKAQVASGEIVEGEQMLGSLLSELERDPTSSAELT
ncbi:MAG: hypothetical protein K8T25_00080, partial [Planctomycetia bacterium]|nr:hypothetical protein [Planctomycetia bacterium]